jgi:predicted O-methyltransferase YrrM
LAAVDPLRRWYHRAILDRWRERFSFFERHGLHVVRASYDSPIPDTRLLADNRWLARSDMVGVDVSPTRQLALLSDLAAGWRAEYAAFPLTENGTGFHLLNGSFGPVDAELLYAILRFKKPKHVIEVGSGNSTRVISKALARNAAEGRPADFVTIDPATPPVETRHTQARVETLPLETFSNLGDGDVLFIDSPHVVTLGGAVAYLFLEVLPRVAPGVWIHVHDIFLPAAYPREWVTRDYRFYNEQLLLQSFLAFNSAFEVEIMASYLHLTHPTELAAAIPSYDPRRDAPGSFWMRRAR